MVIYASLSRTTSFIPFPAAPVAGFFLTRHHPGPTALGTHELPLFMGRMGHFPHLDLAPPTEHSTSSSRTFGKIATDSVFYRQFQNPQGLFC
jgi:hypothetical protein